MLFGLILWLYRRRHTHYNLRDRLERITYPNGPVVSYTYDPAFNRKKVEENTGRMVEYAYDNLYRLTEEKIADSVLGD